MRMVGHIAQHVYYHHVCNIGGIGNCYGLDNYLICGCACCNYYHHSHVHLCLNNYCNNCYGIAPVGCVKLSMVILVLAPIIVLLSPSPLLGSSKGSSATLLTCIWSAASAITSVILIMIIVVCLFIWFLFLWGRGRWLRLLLRFCFAFA